MINKLLMAQTQSVMSKNWFERFQDRNFVIIQKFGIIQKIFKILL